MTQSEENGRSCKMCQEIVGMSEEMQKDLRELYRLLVSLDSYYEEICDRYYDFPGWELVQAHVARAFPQPEELLEVLPSDK